MFSTPTHFLDINTIAEDPVMVDFINKYFPHIYNNVYENKSFSLRSANALGRTLGSVKNFFSKTETKAATLLSYWAADTLIALFLILTSTNTLALTLALSMLALHTYATFSVVNQIMR